MRNLTIIVTLLWALCTNAQQVTELHQIDTWFGQGNDSIGVVVDFQTGNSSFVWGVLFSDSITGEAAVQQIELSDPTFSTTVTSGFLNDLCWGSFCGLGGSPDYWSTWSGDTNGTWESNLGLATMAYPGEWVGLSYTDFNPALEPNTPANASVSIAENIAENFSIGPNPATEAIYWYSSMIPQRVQLIDGVGRVSEIEYNEGTLRVSEFESGMYILKAVFADGSVITRAISIL